MHYSDRTHHRVLHSRTQLSYAECGENTDIVSTFIFFKCHEINIEKLQEWLRYLRAVGTFDLLILIDVTLKY